MAVICGEKNCDVCAISSFWIVALSDLILCFEIAIKENVDLKKIVIIEYLPLMVCLSTQSTCRFLTSSKHLHVPVERIHFIEIEYYSKKYKLKVPHL